MKSTTLLAFLGFYAMTAFISSGVRAQQPETPTLATDHKHIKVQYDRFEDQTTISTDDVLVSSGPGREIFIGVLPPFVQFSYACPGNVSNCKPQSVAVLFKALRPNDRGEWLYLNSHALVFLADGKRVLPATEEKWQGETSNLSLARSTPGATYKQSGMGSTELITTSLSVQDFLELAAAENVEGKLGPTELELSDPDKPRVEKQLRVWRELAERLRQSD